MKTFLLVVCLTGVVLSKFQDRLSSEWHQQSKIFDNELIYSQESFLDRFIYGKEECEKNICSEKHLYFNRTNLRCEPLRNEKQYCSDDRDCTSTSFCKSITQNCEKFENLKFVPYQKAIINFGCENLIELNDKCFQIRNNIALRDSSGNLQQLLRQFELIVPIKYICRDEDCRVSNVSSIMNQQLLVDFILDVRVKCGGEDFEKSKENLLQLIEMQNLILVELTHSLRILEPNDTAISSTSDAAVSVSSSTASIIHLNSESQIQQSSSSSSIQINSHNDSKNSSIIQNNQEVNRPDEDNSKVYIFIVVIAVVVLIGGGMVFAFKSMNRNPSGALSQEIEQNQLVALDTIEKQSSGSSNLSGSNTNPTNSQKKLSLERNEGSQHQSQKKLSQVPVVQNDIDGPGGMREQKAEGNDKFETSMEKNFFAIDAQEDKGEDQQETPYYDSEENEDDSNSNYNNVFNLEGEDSGNQSRSSARKQKRETVRQRLEQKSQDKQSNYKEVDP